IPGVQLLTDVLAFIREHGDITTAGILENWRHDENGAHLRKLAALPLVIEEDGILQEFDGAIDILLQHHRGQQAINTFSKLGAAGLKPSGMSAEEREKFLQAIELSRRDKKPKDVKST
ncbi:MAG: hypothetical protein MJA83_15335, partial [Gammaproteobacteria bacterium]|nr:hypothetical protein [Gammaproteobacteria bacterium]